MRQVPLVSSEQLTEEYIDLVQHIGIQVTKTCIELNNAFYAATRLRDRRPRFCLRILAGPKKCLFSKYPEHIWGLLSLTFNGLLGPFPRDKAVSV
jgi:hypothetical protein